jgi:ferric-dicitrate binding protein FerR (iron transport regulator)
MSKSSDNNLFDILAKHLAGETSEQEKSMLDEMIQSSESAKKAVNNAHSVWSSDCFSNEPTELVSQNENNEKIWRAAFGGDAKKNRMRDRSIFLRVAATLVIIFSIAFVILYMVDKNGPENPVVTIIQKQTLPGQKSSITLRDGSIVWLNSGSKISYQTNFNDSLRIIDLDGQAYFEVFKDKAKPFIVRCRDLEVKALGTSFDVNGYAESQIQISLLTGSVELSIPNFLEARDNVILQPGEYSIIDQNNKFIEKGIFDPYEVLAWKEGRLIFDNATIHQIIPKLELWYGVNIVNELSMNLHKPYTSTFEGENLDNILLNMGGVLQFDYEIKGNDVTLKN